MPHLAEVDLRDEPKRVASAGGSYFGHMAKPCCRDVEAHPEQTQVPVPGVFAIASAQCLSQPEEIHATAVVRHTDHRGAILGGLFWQGDVNARQIDWVAASQIPEEVVEGVIDQLGQALPWLKWDFTQDLKEPRRRAQVEFLPVRLLSFLRHESSRMRQVGGGPTLHRRALECAHS